jgi:TPR repeat protein
MKIFKKLCSFFRKDSVSTQKMEKIEELVLHFALPLLYEFQRHEKEKGSDLTKEEIIAIRDSAVCIALPQSEKHMMDAQRGYKDIDPENCWEEWCAYKNKNSTPQNVNENTKESIEFYRQEANKGYAEAQFKLAQLHMNNFNLRMAVNWYARAANQGHLESTFCLANYYIVGYTEFFCEYEFAFSQYEAAANLGHVKAQYNISLCYKNGVGTEQNLLKALEWEEKAIQNGYIKTDITAEKGFKSYVDQQEYEALNILMNYSQHNESPEYEDQEEKNRQTEKKLFAENFKNALNDDVLAQLYVARCFNAGNGTTQNTKKAIKWFQKAAETGNAEAQNELGMIHFTYSRFHEAVPLFKKAINQENFDCLPQLTRMHQLGVKKIFQDEEEAFDLYNLAAQKGSIYGLHRVAMCYLNGVGTEKNEAEGIKIIQNLAEEGDSDSQYQLYLCYKDGLGVEKDEQKSSYWEEKFDEKYKQPM